MKPQINVITLAVDNLERAMNFYQNGLGLETRGIIGSEFKGNKDEPAGSVVMFNLNDGLILALYPRRELAKDSKQTVSGRSPTEFSIGHLVQTKEEVDQILEKARLAGAELTDDAHDRPWGIYSGYFKDLDGHLWEIIWNLSAS